MKSTVINLTAFVSGASLMAFEILGSRVLAPYFGLTTQVWAALIATVLAALGIGAWIGGCIADRHAGFPAAALLLLLAAFMIPIIPWTAPSICGAATRLIPDPRIGIQPAAALLFLPPGICIGAITPLMIKLAVSDLGHVGRGAGAISAISTLGSIAGTLLAAYILVPNVSTPTGLVLISVPLALCALACLSLGIWQKRETVL